MEITSNTETEIRLWLKTVLKNEDIENFSVKLLGNSEKGDGYVGDIVFVSLVPINGHSGKGYDFVLKCSKRSQALRDKTPVKEAFINEIYIYDIVLPVFTQFQLEKGITDAFNSVPKYYGKFRNENMEILVFENLKKVGYDLWDKKKPLTRKHIEMAIREYAKFHAISIAMKEEKPKQFEELVTGLEDVFQRFVQTSGMEDMFTNLIDEVHDLLKDDLDEQVLSKWKQLKEQIKYILEGMIKEVNGIKVISHGDCWNNNFMFKHAVNNHNLPENVAILDWQISQYSSPILDLSYFLFACISEEDIHNLDGVLKYYHEELTERLKNLGHSCRSIYPFENFLDDWKKYSKYGILMTTVIFKICSTDGDEVVDMAKNTESGEDFGKMFAYDVRNKLGFKKRSKYVVKYVVDQGLI